MNTLSFARFGKSVSFDVPTFNEELHEPKLPEISQQYIWQYGWKQSLSDAFAAAKNEAEFIASVQKRYDAIMAGTVRIGSGRSPADPFEAECLRLARVTVAAAVKAKGLKVDKEKMVALVLQYREKHSDTIEAEATANLDKLKAASAGLDDMFESILGDAPETEEDDETEEVVE